MRHTLMIGLMPILLAALSSAAFEPNPLLNSLPENTCLDLGRYDCATRTGLWYCMSITDYSGFVYDSDRHAMLMMGGGHSATERTDVDVFSFDSLNWRSDYPSTPCTEQIISNMHPYGHWSSTGHPYSTHTWDNLVYCPNIKKLSYITNYKGTTAISGANNNCVTWPFIPGDSTRGHLYDGETKTWAATQSGAIGGEYGAAEYDPVSGRVIYLSQSHFYSYDPINDALTGHSWNNPDCGTAGTLVYFPPNDRFYYFFNSYVDTMRVAEVTLDRTAWGAPTVRRITDQHGNLPAASADLGNLAIGFAYDTVNQIIGGAFDDNGFYSFDPLTSAWTLTAMDMRPAGASFDRQNYWCVNYDPVNNVFVFLAGQYDNRHTWAFRYRSARTAAETRRFIPGLNMTASPNPFNPSTTISFSLRGGDAAAVRILDMAGRVIKTLTDGPLGPGPHSLAWDGRDASGKPMPSGLYIAQFVSENRTLVHKITLIR